MLHKWFWKWLLLDMAADGGQSQRANIEQKVQHALKDLRLEEKMSLSLSKQFMISQYSSWMRQLGFIAYNSSILEEVD